MEHVLLVSRSGAITTALSTIASERYDDVASVVTDRPEDGQYHISPGVVDRIDQRLTDTSALIVDGVVHPGQLADLTERFPSVPVYDRRSIVWKHLSDDNPVAATRLELQECRVDRRRVAAADRAGGPNTPSGTSGRWSALDRQVDALRERLHERQERARQRIAEQYTDVDGHVVLLGQVGANTSSLWSAVTGEQAVSTAGRPAQPLTATATVGPQTVTVTDTPGVPGDEDIPEWFEAAVPGLIPALERADLIVGIGRQSRRLIDDVASQTAAVCERFADPTPDELRSAVDDTFDRRSYRLRLPYSDETHALIANLHNEAVVHDVTYGDVVRVDVELAAAATDTVLRRVEELGGDSEQTKD